MEEAFIERGTPFALRQGKLTLYETNCVCKNIQFYFDQYVLTLMLSGHKTIISDNLKFEFFPGTFFIPEKESINHVSIPNASIYNPTQCLVLELKPSYIEAVYEELLSLDPEQKILYTYKEEASNPYFLSNDQLLIQAFIKLYELQSRDRSPSKALVEDLMIKEMLYRLFCTEGLHLLKRNFDKSIGDERIYKVIKYINSNIGEKLSSSGLAKVAGMGQTTFFKVFKDATGHSPIDFVMNERIRRAKILLKKNKLSLQEIAYRCGFNSYEYFCSSFKKVEHMKPSEFKRKSTSKISLSPQL